MDVREKLVELSDIQVLQREIECVKRKSATNCADCLNCDLLMTDERILSAYANAIDALQNANGVTVQEWVSVKDRLPEPEQGVILCTREIETYGKHHEKKKIYRNIYMGYFDGDEWLTSYCHGCEYIFMMNEEYPNETIEVTHWMPIPRPPKGE